MCVCVLLCPVCVSYCVRSRNLNRMEAPARFGLWGHRKEKYDSVDCVHLALDGIQHRVILRMVKEECIYEFRGYRCFKKDTFL